VKLFGQLIRTAVNVGLVSVAVLKDVRDIAIGEGDSADQTAEALQRLKDEAGEDDAAKGGQ
jgi:hypothetical protein